MSGRSLAIDQKVIQSDGIAAPRLPQQAIEASLDQMALQGSHDIAVQVVRFVVAILIKWLKERSMSTVDPLGIQCICPHLGVPMPFPGGGDAKLAG